MTSPVSPPGSAAGEGVDWAVGSPVPDGGSEAIPTDTQSPAGTSGWRGYVPLVLTALLGTLATLFVYAKVADLEQERRLSVFSEASRDRLLVVQRELAYTLGVVQDIGSFFDASRYVNRRQFREFVGPALKRNPSIHSLEWVPRVKGDERADFVSKARRSFSPFAMVEMDEDGEPVPAVSRSVHYPVLYVQPYPESKDQLGLDLAALPDVLAILDDAAESGAAYIASPEPLPGLEADRYGFFIYLPVYQRAQEGDHDESAEGARLDVDRTSAGIRGFAIGMFRVGELVDRALAHLGPAGVDMRFFATRPSSETKPFYIHSSRTRGGGWSAAGDAPKFLDRPAYVGEIPVGEARTWTVVCHPVPGFFEPEVWNSRLILGGGIAFTLLACVYLYAEIRRAREIRRLVARRTLQLERANQALNEEVVERGRAERALQVLNVTLEHRVARRAAEAERRARDLEQFAYVASHDLKAPLRGIANLAGWLKEDLGDKLVPETREQLDLLCDRVARMNALIEGILAYSRIGRTGGIVEDVDTAALVADVVDSLAPPPGFRVEVAPNMPRMFTDSLHLGQVFANLIGNAIKHHDRDRGLVRVSGREQDDYCEFQVSDDGPGIPAEYQRKVFKMFQTLTVKDFGANTGIGLALVKKLVEEHGGSIRLSSGPGRGSLFELTWQKQEPEQDSVNEQNQASIRGKRDD